YKRDSKELWLDKYKPCSLAELSVHKKKVEEVKVWFEERIITSKCSQRPSPGSTSHSGQLLVAISPYQAQARPLHWAHAYIDEDEYCNYVLLITGQSGVGKSATVHAIASHLGATVCEWNTPTPTIWQEHIHATNSGLRYMSKLDEFENFVEKIRKYGLISSSLTGKAQKPVIILIDDLPVINGKISYSRLQRCLHLLVQSVRIPTVILITEYSKADTNDYTLRCWEELQTSLQSAGACKVMFITNEANGGEKLKITAEQMDVIAKASGGDIRHAITSLQYLSLKSDPIGKGSHKIDNLDDGYSLPFGRDETLSLFHALGKFLHNKRDTETSTASEFASYAVLLFRYFCDSFLQLVTLPSPFVIDMDSVFLKEDFTRLPMKMDAPERVLQQAHGQARPIADFLQENVLDFVDDEAMDDAWVVSSYLSDADTLLASLSGGLSRNYEAENIIQSTAASVAVRGVMFGNRQPLSSRWHAIRRPQLWQVEQSLWRNKKEMVRQKSVAYNGLNLSDISIIATEWQPALKWLGSRASEDNRAQQGSISGKMVNYKGYDGMETCDSGGSGDEDNDDDDEIEDW
ncbi:cell cycle checkpoint protein RAD17 isoform X1, partial [Tanacetum coccineum]